MRILLLSLSLAAMLAGCSGDASKPNIVLVTVDTLRWDYLSPYGYAEADISPVTQRLADNGTVFETAVCTAGTTVPSHASMLTGLYARLHGARSNFHGKYEHVGTVTEALREAGYRTGAFVSNAFLITIGRLGDGFEAHNTPFTEHGGGKGPQGGDRTAAQAAQWLDSLASSEPFFLWMHLWEPHGPYDPTDWSRARLGDYDGMLREGVSIRHIQRNVSEIVNDADHVRAMRTHYAGEVNLADQHLGRLLDHLEESGELDNTVIIFTADHGQSLGEQQRMGHGPVHRETVIRVPLIIADFRAPQARRDGTRVGTIDIAPTIADLAGLDKAFDYAGRSLVGPEPLADDWPYFVEVTQRQTAPSREGAKKGGSESRGYDPLALGVYTGALKMTVRNERYSLYETAPELKVAREIAMTREPVMADYLQGLIESFQEIELDTTAGEVSDEDLKLLQGLGYVQ